MKKVGLMTLSPKTYNYGGFLQELALQDTIMDMGAQCEIVNYAPENELTTFSAKRNIKYLTLGKVYEKVTGVLCKKPVTEMERENIRLRMKAFDDYRKISLRLSEPISYAQLYGRELPYDAIVCGSDQIWNPDFNIPSFFLGFARENQKRIIYAASIGKTKLTALQKHVYSKMLRNLDHISVREQSAEQMVSELTDKPVKLVLDPTLLRDRKYWEEKANASKKEYNKYIFCYFLELSQEKVDAARKFAQKYGCKIVAIPNLLHGQEKKLKENWADVLDANVGPADFLKLIEEADCVLTDSYHACVFSLVFQKAFWVFGRQAGFYNMNTRIHTLLDYYDARHKLIQPHELEDMPCGDAVSSGKRIDEMRELSLVYLKNALG